MHNARLGALCISAPFLLSVGKSYGMDLTVAYRVRVSA